MSMPEQKPGRSKQDYQTPPEFLAAVKSRLCIEEFEFDLAASEENTVVPGRFFSEADNALSDVWLTSGGWLWCNPPYGDIGPWVERAASQSDLGAHIAMLVPASVGANWWRDYVVNESYQLFLNGRLTFVGAEGPYPKDLALILYTPFIRSGSAVWNWREEVDAQGLEQTSQERSA